MMFPESGDYWFPGGLAEDVPRAVDFRWRSGDGFSQASVIATSWIG
jgi:hypothetical protein